jgi:hypothetical protein
MAERQSERPSERSLSALGGGEGRGEVGASLSALTGAHLTLLLLSNGALPLPPKGGEGEDGRN